MPIPPHLRPGTYTLYLGIFAGRQRLPARGPAANPKQDCAAVLAITMTP